MLRGVRTRYMAVTYLTEKDVSATFSTEIQRHNINVQLAVTQPSVIADPVTMHLYVQWVRERYKKS
jgi:hypothetical protein